MAPAPSTELFPGGGWEQPWIAGEEADELVVEYEAGGAWATIEGFGSVTVTVDGESHGALEIPGPGIYELAAHERHGSEKDQPELRAQGHRARWLRRCNACAQYGCRV